MNSFPVVKDIVLNLIQGWFELVIVLPDDDLGHLVSFQYFLTDLQALILGLLNVSSCILHTS